MTLLHIEEETGFAASPSIATATHGTRQAVRQRDVSVPLPFRGARLMPMRAPCFLGSVPLLRLCDSQKSERVSGRAGPRRHLARGG